MIDVDKLAAGPELDALVAEKVMGKTIVGPAQVRLYPGEEFAIDLIGRSTSDWEKRLVMVERCSKGEHGGVIGGHETSCLAPIPEFSTEIAAAWEVVEKLRGWGHLLILSARRGGWDVEDPPFVSTCAPTMPLAICRAALKIASPK